MKLNLYKIENSYCVAKDPVEALQIWWDTHKESSSYASRKGIGVFHTATTAEVDEDDHLKELLVSSTFQFSQEELDYIKELHNACIALCDKFSDTAGSEIAAIRRIVRKKI